jgi:hypothetical protein
MQVKTVPPLGPMRLGFYVAFIALLALFFTVTLPALIRQRLKPSTAQPAEEHEEVGHVSALLSRDSGVNTPAVMREVVQVFFFFFFFPRGGCLVACCWLGGARDRDCNYFISQKHF